MEYRCICGKITFSSQAANSHKANCEQYLKSIGRWEHRTAMLKQGGKNGAIASAKKAAAKKEQKLSIWIAEKHICEKCGKVMTEKFGSGRFCSRACANSREHSQEDKDKLRLKALEQFNPVKASDSYKKLKAAMQLRLSQNIIAYELNPARCSECGKALPYNRRMYSTCSKECWSLRSSKLAKERVKKYGGNINQNNKHGYKQGTYKGIHYDSSWELAYIAYCIDHNIKISRNKQAFTYSYAGKSHIYYPDFIIDNTYIEIKNYWTEQVQAKIDAVAGTANLQILYYKDIKFAIDYCKEKYGKDFLKK